MKHKNLAAVVCPETGNALAKITINLDLMLVRRKMSLTQLSQRVGLSLTNLSLLKTGKVRGIRFSTLSAICEALDCQPGDILSIERDTDENRRGEATRG